MLFRSVKGKFVSQTKLTCVTPDVSDRFGSAEVVVRVALGGDSFTLSWQAFSFFPITHAKWSIMWGPGLLEGVATNEETTFIIQARDAKNRDRTTGGDEFEVRVRQKLIDDEGEIEYRTVRNVEIDDAENGTYAVTYTGQDAGDYLIECEFLGTFGGEKGHVRGSPCTALLDEMAPRANNAINGKLLATRLRDDIDFLLDFTKRTLDIITAQTTSVDWPPERQVNAIAAIKGGIDLIGEREAEVALSLDRVDATLTYLKGMGKNVNAQMAQLGSAREKWEDLKDRKSVV